MSIAVHSDKSQLSGKRGEISRLEEPCTKGSWKSEAWRMVLTAFGNGTQYLLTIVYDLPCLRVSLDLSNAIAADLNRWQWSEQPPSRIFVRNNLRLESIEGTNLTRCARERRKMQQKMSRIWSLSCQEKMLKYYVWRVPVRLEQGQWARGVSLSFIWRKSRRLGLTNCCRPF